MTASTKPDLEQQVATHFANDTADHQMTVLHDDGLYRHLRFKAPGTSIGYFDLITWPWNLTVGGDRDSYTFRREEDMFGFFRSHGHQHGINPGYWAQKMVGVGGPRACKEYSRLRLDANVDEILAEAETDWPGISAAWAEHLEDYDVEYESPAHEALNSFEFQVAITEHVVPLPGDAKPAPGSPLRPTRVRTFQFADWWEWDLTDWDFHFLWSCHAIRWGIAQYCKARAATP